MLSKIGLEAEFLLLNAKDEVIIPPTNWDRDGFPLLGEIRANPANNTPEVVANFIKKKWKLKPESVKVTRSLWKTLDVFVWQLIKKR